MLPAFLGTAVRAAEGPALAAAAAEGDPDRFMRAAAHGLANVVLRHLGGLGLPPADVPGPTPQRECVRRLAARGVAGARVVALVGSGNNGGDGLFALALLARRGAQVAAIQIGERRHQAAAAALLAAGGRLHRLGTPAAERALAGCEVVLDAALGTGARGGVALPEPPQRAWRIPCDLPSGVDADSGAASALVPWADDTVCFGAVTVGTLLGRGRELSGAVRLVPIPGLLDPALLGRPEIGVLSATDSLDSILSPLVSDHKYSRGVLGLVAGSADYPGAAILCGEAALTTGVGMLSAWSSHPARELLVAALPEAVVRERAELLQLLSAEPSTARIAAWVLGPGLGEENSDLEAAASILRRGLPAVVDASALAVVAPPYSPGNDQVHASSTGAGITGAEKSAADNGGADGTEADGAAEAKWVPRLLTPHAGELRALGERLGLGLANPLTQPLSAVRQAAKALDAVVLLKGSTTLVAEPDGRVLAACAGEPWLAVAGSGDTLAGIAGALLATHAARAAGEGRPLGAAELVSLGASAALLHGLAGRAAPGRGAAALAEGLRLVLRSAGPVAESLPTTSAR